VNEKLIPIAPDEPFRFACSAAVACFNECCRDLNQFLYPYDILRLKKRLGLSSGEFLERYTTQHIGPQSGLPIVALKTTDNERFACPFVTENGCRVYSDRPSSCRTYPLVRAISRSRESGKITERFMLLNEPHCLGFNEPKEQTVRQWIKEQGIETDNPINDKLMEIISLKNRLRPGPLDLKSRHLFYVALYDLDNFRKQIFNNNLFGGFKVNPQKLAAAKIDDTTLLEIGIEWVKQSLFKEEAL
jgi:Fe-S-cluster containining protein